MPPQNRSASPIRSLLKQLASLLHIQAAGTLSGLLVVETSRRASPHSASAETAHCSGIRATIRPDHPGRNRNLLRRDDRRRGQPLPANLLHRTRSAPGEAGAAALPRTIRTSRSSKAIARSVVPQLLRQIDRALLVVARCWLLRMGRRDRRSESAGIGVQVDPRRSAARARHPDGRRGRNKRRRRIADA